MQSKAGVAWPVGPVGSEDHAATAGGGASPPPGQGFPVRALRKGSGTTRPESGRREGLAARCVLLPFGKAAQGVE